MNLLAAPAEAVRKISNILLKKSFLTFDDSTEGGAEGRSDLCGVAFTKAAGNVDGNVEKTLSNFSLDFRASHLSLSQRRGSLHQINRESFGEEVEGKQGSSESEEPETLTKMGSVHASPYWTVPTVVENAFTSIQESDADEQKAKKKTTDKHRFKEFESILKNEVHSLNLDLIIDLGEKSIHSNGKMCFSDQSDEIRAKAISQLGMSAYVSGPMGQAKAAKWYGPYFVMLLKSYDTNTVRILARVLMASSCFLKGNTNVQGFMGDLGLHIEIFKILDFLHQSAGENQDVVVIDLQRWCYEALFYLIVGDDENIERMSNSLSHHPHLKELLCNESHNTWEEWEVNRASDLCYILKLSPPPLSICNSQG
eukprot:Nk52_evm36s359 gene=Nk52_evmTU36s359